jgi:hypothetical protein
MDDDIVYGKERRMVLRILEYWREARGEKPMPPPAAFDAEKLPDYWPFCFVLDVAKDPDNPEVVSAGRTVASYVPYPLTGKRVAEFEPKTLPTETVTYMGEVLRKKVPVSRGGTFRDARGATILYRSIMLPLSEDGSSISALLVAANCREVPV